MIFYRKDKKNMSKYNDYAKKLETAFLTARQEYSSAYKTLDWAERNLTEAKRTRKEDQIAFAEALHTLEADKFKDASARIWKELNAKRQELQSALYNELRKDFAATPADIDAAGLELLKSGILTPDEFKRLADQYSGNHTMQRLVARYASEAADSAKDTVSRAALSGVSQKCGQGQNEVMRAWETLSKIVDACSAATAKSSEPAYIMTMSGKWDDMARDVVDGF